jgi:hypothetical protein
VTRGGRITGHAFGWGGLASAVLSFLVPSKFAQGLLGGASVVGALVCFALAWRAARAPEEKP